MIPNLFPLPVTPKRVREALAECSVPRIAVVMPAYRVGRRPLALIARMPASVGWIFVVDDACPEGSGDEVARHCVDPRVQVLRHDANQGVGGAVVTGYQAALQTPAEAVVKLDGDGQMDPDLIDRLAAPVLARRADYNKGNRFHQVSDVRRMPRIRLLGNAWLSFLSKLSTGYWQLFDPTNGFTAIHRDVLEQLPLPFLARRYFFESDLLFRLGQLRAVVHEMPMPAVYDDEPSSLRPLQQIWPFLRGHGRNLLRRIVYDYLLRGFSMASVQLLLGLALLGGGGAFGLWQWIDHAARGVTASAGTVMLAALPVLIGMQCLLAWLAHDMAAWPREPICADTPPKDPPIAVRPAAGIS